MSFAARRLGQALTQRVARSQGATPLPQSRSFAAGAFQLWNSASRCLLLIGSSSPVQNNQVCVPQYTHWPLCSAVWTHPAALRADAHGEVKVNAWEAPTQISQWKEEHVRPKLSLEVTDQSLQRCVAFQYLRTVAS